MFIIYIIDLSTKNENVKMGVHILTKRNKKTPDSCKQKNFFFFPVIPFQKLLIFHICNFSENAQCFVRAFL